jgi:hypothetical protein
MGHNVVIVDYRPRYHSKRYRWQWKRGGINGANLCYLLLNRRFEKFRKEYLKTTRCYISFQELQESPPEVDAYICGSDQIWSSQLTGNDPAYFLDFVPNGVRRIAYAGSFGMPQISDFDKQVMKNYFRKMDAISSRELSGTQLVQDMFGGAVAHVLDPTL